MYLFTYTCAVCILESYSPHSVSVAVGTFGLQSDEALMSVVGALIEIPTMLSLVKLAFVFRSRWVFQKKNDAGLTAI